MIFLVLPDISEEDALMDELRAGSPDAMLRVYQLYFRPIYEYIRLRVEDAPIAEDIASEVFLRLIDAVRKHQAPRQSLRGWLFKVARTLIAAQYHEAKKLPTTTLEEWMPSPVDDDPEINLIRTISLERARHAIRNLSADQQEVLILRFGQRLSLQETCDIMGRSMSAVKSLQLRAIESLRKHLREMGELGDIRLEGRHV